MRAFPAFSPISKEISRVCSSLAPSPKNSLIVRVPKVKIATARVSNRALCTWQCWSRKPDPYNRHRFRANLLAKVLGLNETQESALALSDLSDLRGVASCLTSDTGKEELKNIGGVASATAGVILRNVA